MKSLKNITKKIVEDCISKNNIIEAKILLNWNDIFTNYNRITVPTKVIFFKNNRSDGTLFLNVQNGFGPEIQMVIPKFLIKINDFLGYKAISKIIIKQINF